MNTEKKGLANAEKMKRWREEKIKKKEADKKYFKCNHERKFAKVEENRDRKKGQLNMVNKDATPKKDSK